MKNISNNKNSEINEQIKVMPKIFRNLEVSDQGKVVVEKKPEHAPDGPKKSKSKREFKKIYILWIVVAVFIVAVLGYSAYLFIWSEQLGQEEVVLEEVQEIPEEVQQLGEEPEEAVAEDELVEPDEEQEMQQIEEFSPENLQEVSLDAASTIDNDNDGLTDAEELILSTNPSSSDSDKDGYVDGLEVFNLYNPQGTAPVKLEFTSLVKAYSNSTFAYALFYPEPWFAESVDDAGFELIISSTDYDFVNVFTVDKPADQDLTAWYMEQVPDLGIEDVENVVNRFDTEGIVSPDGFTYYFAQDDLVYIIHYNLGTGMQVKYPTLFKMIANSFHFLD